MRIKPSDLWHFGLSLLPNNQMPANQPATSHLKRLNQKPHNPQKVVLMIRHSDRNLIDAGSRWKEKKRNQLNFFCWNEDFFVSFQLVQKSGRHGSEPEIVLQNLRPCSRWTSHPPGCSRSSWTHGSWNRPSDLAVVRLLRWPVKPTWQLGRIVYKAKNLTDQHLFLILLRSTEAWSHRKLRLRPKIAN